MEKSDSRRALVIGGSISGLFAALLLERHGWRVDVYERSAGELAGRGAGIVAQPELREALAAAGIGDIGEVGVPVDQRILLDNSGRELMRIACPQTVTSWERVHRLLRARFPDERYHSGKEVKRIDTSGELPRAEFADGSRIEAELVIGADGIRSTVRQQFFPEARLDYTGYVGWRSLIEERAFSTSTHARTFWTMAFGLPPGEQFLGYPVTGPNDDMTPGNLRWNMIWYRPADERELRRLLTDATGREHEISIPPPLIRLDVRAELKDAAERLLAPEFAEAVALSPQSFLQPIYDLESSRLAIGRVAVIGDAAFVARPHVAAGVIKAAEDVLSMVSALDEEKSVTDALQRFQTERLAVGRRILARARKMGASYKARPAGGPMAPGDHDMAYARSVVEYTALTTFLREPG
jgi:2-polyprenyl-6-methoxyphenol hydroxylase-like FAD-dependent oxidoreductase